MASKKKYVAYVSTYTMGDQHGIKIYDVDVTNGCFKEKDQVEISNSSYVTISHDEEFLYSITDFGVESYRILADGGLEFMNHASINGMRGCYLSTDYEEKFLFVAGYHDGKITVLRLHGDGSVGDITDEIYLKGMGTVTDRNFRPHASCVKMTRDNQYLMAADIGMDHVDVYRLDHATGKLKLIDVIRSEIDSAPRHIKMTKDGRFVYIVHEMKCQIDVYEYSLKNGNPVFNKLQSVSTLNDYHAGGSAASALNFSMDEKYMVSSNAGDNSAAVFEIDHKSGELNKLFCLPVSGDYPKDVALFPDNRHLVSLNHESGTMTFFTTDLKKGLIVMNGKEMKIESPNCIIFHAVGGE